MNRRVLSRRCVVWPRVVLGKTQDRGTYIVLQNSTQSTKRFGLRHVDLVHCLRSQPSKSEMVQAKFRELCSGAFQCVRHSQRNGISVSQFRSRAKAQPSFFEIILLSSTIKFQIPNVSLKRIIQNINIMTQLRMASTPITTPPSYSVLLKQALVSVLRQDNQQGLLNTVLDNNKNEDEDLRNFLGDYAIASTLTIGKKRRWN